MDYLHSLISVMGCYAAKGSEGLSRPQYTGFPGLGVGGGVEKLLGVLFPTFINLTRTITTLGDFTSKELGTLENKLEVRLSGDTEGKKKALGVGGPGGKQRGHLTKKSDRGLKFL